jgi:aminopeptidase
MLKIVTDLSGSNTDAIAQILVAYSTQVVAGDRVLVIMREVETFPLARAVGAAALRRGGLVQTLFASTSMQRDLLLEGTDDQVGWVPEVWRHAMEWADVCIDLRGFRNPHEFEGISSERIAHLRRAEGEISALRTSGTRWTILRVPNEAFAQQAGMSMDAAAALFSRAVLQDWEEECVAYTALQTRLQGAKEVQILGVGTDLTFSTDERIYVVDDGRINMPGGEVYTAPEESSVRGVITFEHPSVYAGVSIEGIRLAFRDGRVVDAAAGRNERFLHELLDMDEGARSVGEFGIGTNRYVDRFTNDLLYDEKIMGTVHIALGRSYTECGGTNWSALHWDIVKDLREAGSVLFDGVPFFENGAWTVLKNETN